MQLTAGEVQAAMVALGAPLAGWVAVALSQRGRVRSPGRAERWTTVAMVVFFVMYSSLAVLKLAAYNMGAEDLGRVDQAIWNSLHGNLLTFSASELGRDMSRLAGHVELAYLLLAPLFLLWNSAAALLIAQAGIVAAGAWPAMRIGQRIGGDGLGLASAFAYLAHPAVGHAVLADVHGDTLAMPALLFALDRGLAGRSRSSFLFTVLAVSAKEYVAALAVTLGLYWMFAHRRRRLGASCIVLGLAWALLVVPAFHARYRPADFPQLTPLYYAELGTTPREVVVNSLLHPDRLLRIMLTPRKLGVIAMLLAPLALAPLRCPIPLSLCLPVLIPLAASDHLDLRNHHNATLIPFLLLAAIQGAHALTGRHAALLIAAATAVAHGAVGPSLVSARSWTPGGWDYLGNPHVVGRTRHDQIVSEVLARVPATAAVTASGHLVPHLSHRPVCFTFPAPRDPTLVEYAIVDLVGHYPPSFRPRSEVLAGLRSFLDAGFGVTIARDGVLLLERGAGQVPAVAATASPVCRTLAVGPLTLRRHRDGALSWSGLSLQPILVLDVDTRELRRAPSAPFAVGDPVVGDPEPFPAGARLAVVALVEGFPALVEPDPPQPWLPETALGGRLLPPSFECDEGGAVQSTGAATRTGVRRLAPAGVLPTDTKYHPI